MKRIIEFSALILSLALSVVGCQKEQLSTDQYGDTLTFSAFGPNPVYRGSELTIIGSCLDQVKEVIIPGVDPITSFNVTGSGRECKLTLTVPKDGPTVGTVSIVGKDGTKLTAIGELTYTEPVVFTSFTPSDAMPGDVITITGDYLNLIKEVIFEGGAYVTAFESQSRYELKVTVPSNAISGRLIIGDSDEVLEPDVIANKVYSDDALNIGDPTVADEGEFTIKAWDKHTITGKYLDMVSYLKFEGATLETFDLSEDGGSISFEMPAEAGDGKYYAVSYAGTEFEAGEITTVVPTGLEAEPSPVLSSETLIISGKDLDLVVKAEFPGSGEAEYWYNEGVIEITVPAKAQEGNITLTQDNGKSVEVPFTLVHPTVSGVTPLELTAGQDITVSGTALQLVTAATLGGKDVEFSVNEDGTVLTLTTNNTSVGGKVVLSLANSETVEPSEEIKLNYDSFIITTGIPASAPIAGLVTLTGENFNMAESIYVGDTKVTSYVSRIDTEVKFYMPYMKVGSYSLKYVLYSGDEEICPTPIQVTLQEEITVICQGEWDMGSWSNQPYLGAEDAFADAAVGDIVRIYYTPTADWFQFQIYDGHWGGTSIAELGGGQTVSPDTWTGTAGYFEFVLTAQLKSQFYNPSGWGGAMLTQGENCVITMITCTHLIPQEKTLWEGEAVADGWGNQPYLLTDTGPELKEAGAEAGQEVRFYITPCDGGEWKVQIVEGHWGATYASFCKPGADTEGGKFTEWDLDAHGGYISITLTEEMLNAAYTQQWWGGVFLANGDDTKITKITLF